MLSDAQVELASRVFRCSTTMPTPGSTDPFIPIEKHRAYATWKSLLGDPPCILFLLPQNFAKRGMKVDDASKEERLQAQKEAQQKMEVKKTADKEKRLKELAAEKEAAMLKATK